MDNIEENNSGMGKNSEVPAEIKNKFNWGAFGLVFIWSNVQKLDYHLEYLFIYPAIVLAIFSKYKQYRMIIPSYVFELLFFSVIAYIVVISFIAGKNGNKWAWQYKKWNSIQEFQAEQRRLARLGIIWLVFVAFIMIPIIPNIFTDLFLK